MIFERLPTVKKCCCCLPLKLGVILIGLYFITISLTQHSIDLVVDLSQEACYSSMYHVDCPFKTIMPFLMYLVYFVAFMSFLPSTFLIMAVFINNRVIITMFLYFTSVAMCMDLIIDVSILIINLVEPRCKTHGTSTVLICIAWHMLVLVVFFYFIIVVTSFRSSLVSYRSRHDQLTDSSGNIITRDDAEKITRYGRINITRRYSNVIYTKISKTDPIFNENKTGAKITETHGIKTKKYIGRRKPIKQIKNVNLHIDSNRTIKGAEEDDNVDSSGTVDSSGPIHSSDSVKSEKDQNSTTNVMGAEMVSRSSTQPSKSKTTANNSISDGNKNFDVIQTKVIADIIKDIIQEINISKDDTKIKADVKITKADVVETDKGENSNKKRSSEELIETSSNKNNTEVDKPRFNEIYRFESNIIEIPSKETSDNSTNGNENKINKEKTNEKEPTSDK